MTCALGPGRARALLKRIHRSKEDLWWTESCLRLRDFTCTKEGDYDWWRQHDLDRGHLNAEQKEYFEDHALWLCARCEDVGARNGRKLAHRTLDRGSRKDFSALGVLLGIMGQPGGRSALGGGLMWLMQGLLFLLCDVMFSCVFVNIFPPGRWFSFENIEFSCLVF